MKNGDRIRVKGPILGNEWSCQMDHRLIGREGVVNNYRIPTTMPQIEVLLDGDNGYRCFLPGELELVKEEKR